MRTYIARRVAAGLLVLWLVSLLIFSLVRILPGDAVIMQLDQAAAPTPEALTRARQELGLDRPFLAQYRTWIAGAVQGDLGRSLITRRPVTQELLKRINLTSHLAVMSVIIALLIALPIGVLSAVRQDTASDYVGRLVRHPRPVAAGLLARHRGHHVPRHLVSVDPAHRLRAALGGPGALPEPAPDPGRSSSGRAWPRCPCG